MSRICPGLTVQNLSKILYRTNTGRILDKGNDRAHDLQLSISICKGKRPEIIESTPQCYVDLMKKCWSEDPLERPSAKEISNIIANWIFYPFDDIISEELKGNIMEFINAPIGNNNFITESHPQACYTSRLLDFTSIKMNEILESKYLDCIVDDKSSRKLNETEESECLDCVVNNINLSDIKTDKN
ncbi:hypothetical protein RclHR1_25700001 [Rhizophagus clarus]|uniref:Serine-threonine/tyrosine-protein kinase catalytic domain-containing protein n=1 Tax=Rhizophagus clarus TaxID=94130 RepID=A0A2Z6QZJ5_9GLOM|nr:hypothetical protein RclHR1_25700001 [Rhizophagus clarus]